MLNHSILNLPSSPLLPQSLPSVAGRGAEATLIGIISSYFMSFFALVEDFSGLFFAE